MVSGAFVLGPGGWGWAEQASNAALVLLFGWIVIRAMRRGAEPVALVGSLTAVIMLSSRILSAQYLVWLAPMVVLLAARGHPRVAQLMTVAGLLTLFEMIKYDELIEGWAGRAGAAGGPQRAPGVAPDRDVAAHPPGERAFGWVVTCR